MALGSAELMSGDAWGGRGRRRRWPTLIARLYVTVARHEGSTLVWFFDEGQPVYTKRATPGSCLLFEYLWAVQSYAVVTGQHS